MSKLEFARSIVQYANERGNRILHSIFYRLAVMVTMTTGKNRKIINPVFYEYYHRKISEGKTKRQALKCVQRRLVNIIWKMMTYKIEYINPPTEDFPKAQESPHPVEMGPLHNEQLSSWASAPCYIPEIANAGSEEPAFTV